MCGAAGAVDTRLPWPACRSMPAATCSPRMLLAPELDGEAQGIKNEATKGALGCFFLVPSKASEKALRKGSEWSSGGGSGGGG